MSYREKKDSKKDIIKKSRIVPPLFLFRLNLLANRL